MNKILDFIKTNFIVVTWTAVYFACLWAILWYLFRFDIFSNIHWWKFFHSHLRGFIGLVFGLLIYTAIPIYIATTAIVYRTKKFVFKIPFYETIATRLKAMFTKPTPEPEPEPESESENKPESEYPENLPSEMRIPFTRMKQRLSFVGTISVFNKSKTDSEYIVSEKESEPESFPIPTDFDIGDSLPDTSVPTFTDVNFDEPTQSETEDNEEKVENTVTKYFDEHDTEYETYKDFVITEKHIIYVHNEPDFWILDDETWFAAGKQKDSPVSTMLEIANENGLKPIIYFETTNIMDFEGTVKSLTNKNITVLTSLEELSNI